MRTMAMLIVLLSGLLVSQSSATRINASGVISTNTTWTADTVVLTGNVSVRQGVLTILPGTLVRFGYTLTLVDSALGAIHAVGTPDRMITFKGTSSRQGGPIKFSALVYDSLSIFQYCVVESMTPCFEFRNPPNNPSEAACPLIDHCIVRASGYCNVYVTGGASPTFSNCYFNNATSGIFIHGAGNKMKVLNCVISNMGGGIINASAHPRGTLIRDIM